MSYGAMSPAERASLERERAMSGYYDARTRADESEQERREREQRMKMEELRREAFIRDAQVARDLIDRGRPDLAKARLRDRLEAGSEMGLDMRDTEEGLRMLESGDVGSFMETTGAILTQWQQRQAQKEGPGRSSPKTMILDDGTTVMVDDQKRVDVFSASGERLTGEAASEAIRKAQEYGADVQGLRSGERAAGKQAIKLSGEAYEKLQTVSESKRLMQRAIETLDRGAETGPIMSRLPTVSKASAALDQVQKELGLNVIQNTTFGSLSQDELKFALDTALPDNLTEPELRAWLERKIRAQEALEAYLYRAATYLGRPGNTLESWLTSQREAANKSTYSWDELVNGVQQ